MSNMESLLDCMMDLGKEMLICGGEVHWIEESLCTILRAYGATQTDVFIITSSMVVTVHTENGEAYTQTRRISDTTSDFERLHAFNNCSRWICAQHPSPEEIRAKITSITAKTKQYPLWLNFLCYAVIAAAFTLFFGGSFLEAGVSFLVGLLMRSAIWVCDRTISNKIFTKFFAAFAATLFSLLAMHLSFIAGVDKVMIGNIMTLIPGIGLTNALRDLFVGDSIAGLLRTIEACIAALAIAGGFFAAVFITGGAGL
jgi:uncharacterized membrane protein YjjP (DUF1212 family)